MLGDGPLIGLQVNFAADQFLFSKSNLAGTHQLDKCFGGSRAPKVTDNPTKLF